MTVSSDAFVYSSLYAPCFKHQLKTWHEHEKARFSHPISAEMKAARRWLPWIGAYTNARISKLTPLTAADFVKRDGIWIIRIRGQERVVVPIYSNDPNVRLLHDLMHLLLDVELAKLVKPILGLGWIEFRHLTTLSQGPVQVYRMSAGDYLALILDTVPGKGVMKKQTWAMVPI
jgi:hypothetical protein